MEQLGTDFNATGSVMSRAELEEQRRRRGECVTCGRRCFQRRVFRMIPLTEHGLVENGRCLNCNPLNANEGGSIPAVARPATQADVARFQRAQTRGDSRRKSGSGSASIQSTQSSDRRSNFNSNSSGRRSRGVASGGLSSRSLQTRVSTASNGSSGAYSAEFYSAGSQGSLQQNYSRPGIGRPSSSRSMGANSIYSARSRTSVDGSSANSSADVRTGNRQSIEEDDVEEAVDTSLNYYQRSYHGHSARSVRSQESHESHEGTLDRDGAMLFERRRQQRREQHPNESKRIRRGTQTSTRSLESSGSSFETEEDLRFGGGPSSLPDEQSSSLAETPEEFVKSSSSVDDASVDEEDEIIYALDRIRDSADDFRQIMDCMKDFADVADVLATGLKALASVELSGRDSSDLIGHGFIPLVIDTMRAYADDIEIQVFGCRAIWNASGTPENQRACMDALDTVLAVMPEHSSNGELQEQGLAVIANLGALAENVPILHETGAVRLLVETMNKHASNRNVQVKGCLALTNMASHPDAPKHQIVGMGGGSAVVISMVMHPGDSELQEKSLCALRNLSADCSDNRVELTNIGGIDAIVSAMQVHRDVVSVQQAGAWTLSNLALNQDSNVLIGDCGGIEVVVRAMWVHDSVQDIQEWCCRALYTFSVDNHNAQIILGVSGVKAVVNAMQNHVDASAIQEMACAVLGNLAFDKESKMQIVDEEALDAIVLAMVIHGEDGNVNERACALLLNLSIAENFKAMQASNVGELVAAAAAKFPEGCGDAAEELIHVIEGYLSEYT